MKHWRWVVLLAAGLLIGYGWYSLVKQEAARQAVLGR